MIGGQRGVLLIAHDIEPPGGMERVYTELIRRRPADLRLTVVSSSLSKELRELVDWRRVPVPRRPTWLKFIVFYLRAAFIVARQRGAIVHTVGAIIPNRADLISVHFCHAAFRERRRRHGSAGRPLARRINDAIATSVALLAERWSYRPGRVKVMAADSSGIEQELSHRYHVTTVITPNGVNSQYFQPNPAVRAAVREAHGISEDTVVALFVGGDWHRKGLGLAISALAHAIQLARHPLMLWVVGAGDVAHFRARARVLEVAERVRFLGRVPDQLPFYQAADLFIFPTLYEGFPLVSLEAAACALPLLAAKASGLEDLVGDNQAGLLVERTVAATGAGLVRLADDPALRRRLGLAARRRAQQYSWERAASRVGMLYQELLAASGPVMANQ